MGRSPGSTDPRTLKITPKITAARVHPWIDTDTLTPLFGVQVKASGTWRHLAVGGNPAMFRTQQDAQASADEIMRQVKA